MSSAAAFVAILLAILLGAISPGPSFVVVARSAISQSRRHGLATALGMGVGGAVFSVLALLGLYSLLAAVGWLYGCLKLAGGLYLLWLALRIWRGATTPLTVETAHDKQHDPLLRAFWLGLSTQLSNPKTAIVYGSIFAALLPRQPAAWCSLALPPAILLTEAGWYALVAFGFSSSKPQAVYLRAKQHIDRLAASAIGLLGLRLILSAPRTGL
jgi:threonine/homoserine/homoserine lactone efflux protein